MNNRIGKQIDELVGALTDPIIVWPSPWQDTLPEWIKPAITVERLIENMKVLKGEAPTATDAEVLAYLYPPVPWKLPWIATGRRSTSMSPGK